MPARWSDLPEDAARKVITRCTPRTLVSLAATSGELRQHLHQQLKELKVHWNTIKAIRSVHGGASMYSGKVFLMAGGQTNDTCCSAAAYHRNWGLSPSFVTLNRGFIDDAGLRSLFLMGMSMLIHIVMDAQVITLLDTFVVHVIPNAPKLELLSLCDNRIRLHPANLESISRLITHLDTMQCGMSLLLNGNPLCSEVRESTDEAKDLFRQLEQRLRRQFVSWDGATIRGELAPALSMLLPEEESEEESEEEESD